MNLTLSDSEIVQIILSLQNHIDCKKEQISFYENFISEGAFFDEADEDSCLQNIHKLADEISFISSIISKFSF